MRDQLRSYSRELEDELREILDYWMQNAVDHEYGGFYGKIDHFNHIIRQSSKGGVLNARILWAFSAAYNHLKDDKYLNIAHRAYSYLDKFFVDKEDGGLIWEVDYLGKPADFRKQTYAQAFGIYGFSEYYKASGDVEPLEGAISLFHNIERHGYDAAYGGYIEAFDKHWNMLSDMRLSEKDKNFPKTMNTHLHILESYSNLYRVWKQKELANRIRELIQIFQNYILDVKRGHFNLFFERNWEIKSDITSFGHDIEGAWLLLEAAQLLGDKELWKQVSLTSMGIIDATISEGMHNDCSLYYELDRSSGFLDTERHWWPQAEAMVGFICAFQITGDDAYLEKSRRTWEFVRHFIKDKEHGEWHWSVDKEGIPNAREDKAGFWKCPYHNGRACMEILKRISLVNN